MSSSHQQTPVRATIFREYIGWKEPSPFIDFPAEIINPEVEEFHFILAFATESYDKDTKKGNGKFTASWNLQSFSAENIKKLKDEHQNVKVVISIGGRGSNFHFYPDNRDAWLANARSSIQVIIDSYNRDPSGRPIHIIDGIDVNYENILSSTNDFVYCIGKLITYLKNNNDGYINVVSIAPSEAVEVQYRTLYQTANYRDYIDWVDYQFYDQTFPDTATFINYYRALAQDYPSILLAGISTDPSDDKGYVSLAIFLEGCFELLQSKLLPGIFVFAADYSIDAGFPVEKIAQRMIVDSNNIP